MPPKTPMPPTLLMLPMLAMGFASSPYEDGTTVTRWLHSRARYRPSLRSRS